ncbi:hypothetical protein [Chryseobacterium indoltheticum]|uniref:hypothetical protein n=1 Tax=Chryseobacterium indoltheticum TaxID=254 RepID=UPI003F492E89
MESINCKIVAGTFFTAVFPPPPPPPGPRSHCNKYKNDRDSFVGLNTDAKVEKD